MQGNGMQVVKMILILKTTPAENGVHVSKLTVDCGMSVDGGWVGGREENEAINEPPVQLNKNMISQANVFNKCGDTCKCWVLN